MLKHNKLFPVNVYALQIYTMLSNKFPITKKCREGHLHGLSTARK